MHLTAAMMQPSVANASHSCNFPQRCRGAHRAPADILPTSNSPPQRPPSSREGDRPRRWKEFAHRAPADILPTLDFPAPKTSLLEGGGPPQRWKEFAHRAPADILQTLDFPPLRPPSSREGDRPVGGGRSSQRWKESKKAFPKLHMPHMPHMHHMPDTHQAYDVFSLFLNYCVIFPQTQPSKKPVPRQPFSVK